MPLDGDPPRRPGRSETSSSDLASLEGGRVMDEYGHNSFPLTVAQRGLWMTQKITPGAILNIAEAVEICGPINSEIFQRALHQVTAEAEQLRVCVVEENGKPRQALRTVYPGDFPYVDM